MEVGVRELKNNLSQYLARVAEGSEVIVTARGHAVARITPIDRERTIDRLIRLGIVTVARSTKRPAPMARPLANDSVSALVADQRR